MVHRCALVAIAITCSIPQLALASEMDEEAAACVQELVLGSRSRFVQELVLGTPCRLREAGELQVTTGLASAEGASVGLAPWLQAGVEIGLTLPRGESRSAVPEIFLTPLPDARTWRFAVGVGGETLDEPMALAAYSPEKFELHVAASAPRLSSALAWGRGTWIGRLASRG